MHTPASVPTVHTIIGNVLCQSNCMWINHHKGNLKARDHTCCMCTICTPAPKEIWPLLVECLSLQSRNLSFSRWSVLTWMVLHSVFLLKKMETCYINSQAQTIYFLAFFFGAPPEGLERLIPLVMPNAACFGASYSLPEGSKVYNENLEVLDVQVSTHTQPMQSNTERNNWNHVAGLEKSPDNRKVLVLHVHISSCQLSDTCVEIPWSQANRKPNNFTCMSYSKTQTSEATASMVWQGSISESEKKSCNQVTQRSHQTWSALMPAHAQNPTSWFGWSNLNTHSFWQGFVFQDHDLAPKEWLQPFWSPSAFYCCPYWSCPCHPSHPGLFPYLTSWEVHQVCLGLQLLMLEWRVKARQWRGQVQQKAGCAVETWIDAITLRVMSIYGNDESNSESLKVFQRIYNGNTWGNSWLLTRLWERHISSCTMPMLLLSMLVPRSTVRPKLKAQVMPKHNWRTSTLQCWCTSISEFCFFAVWKFYCCQGTVPIDEADLLFVLEH